jgi:hypothetical protein
MIGLFLRDAVIVGIAAFSGPPRSIPVLGIVRLWRSTASVSPVPSATLPRSMATVRHVGACRITGKKTNNHAKRARANSENNFLVCHGD